MEDATYSVVSVNYNNKTSNNTDHYFCDILDFNTGILWHCDDDTITQSRVILDNVYSVAPYLTPGK